jgi:predicted dehydrogenase
VVSVCTPDHTHAQIAIDVLKSGKHLILEKPMAQNMEDCNRILDIAEKSGVRMTVCFEYRFNPIFRDIDRMIKKNELGRLQSFSIYYWRQPFREKINRWIQKAKYTKSMLLQEGCHYFDLMRWYCGEVESVNALGNGFRKDIEYDQTIFANIKFQDGAIGQFAHTILGFQFRHIIWAIGTKAAAYGQLLFSCSEGSYGSLKVKQHQEDISEDAKEELIKKVEYGPEVDDEANIARLIDVFLEATRKDDSFPITGLDGKKSVELALATELSVSSNFLVNLPLSGKF